MTKKTMRVAEIDKGKRLDKYLADILAEECSRMHIKTLINDKHVKVNEKDVKAHYLIQDKDMISIDLILPEGIQNVEPEDIPLDIIYEDNSLLIINKPSGMVVHPGAGNKKGTMVGAVLNHCGTLADTGDKSRPGIVHRLDKDTTGIIVVAKTDRAMRSLGKQFQNRTVSKSYLAVVKGVVEYDNGEIAAPLTRNVTERKKMMVEHTIGRKAKTVYHVIKRYKKFTFLRLEPETGRTHQIRVHLKYIGYPIVGDRLYGRSTESLRQLLHAEKIRFTHPGTGQNVFFEAPVPEDMRLFLENAENPR